MKQAPLKKAGYFSEENRFYNDYFLSPPAEGFLYTNLE